MYQSYLLRLWQDSSHAPWRASVQSVQTSAIVYFADLDALVTFLWRETTPRLTPEQLPPQSLLISCQQEQKEGDNTASASSQFPSPSLPDKLGTG